MQDHDIETNTKELTLADIEELRNALGAEAEVNPGELETAAVPSTIMCPQWY